MGFTYTQKLVLIALHGGHCARCRTLLTDIDLKSEPVLIGQSAHIVGSSEEGPRGDMPSETIDRDSFDNAVYLCANCHIVVDNREEEFTRERLREIRGTHLAWVRTLGKSAEQLSLAEQYGPLIDDWMRLSVFNQWQEWTRYILSYGPPALPLEVYNSLSELSSWYLKRLWTNGIPRLDSVLIHFGRVLKDFLDFFNSKGCDLQSNVMLFWNFPKPDTSDVRVHHQHALQRQFRLTLLEDLTFELTRAANLVCETIRSTLDPQFFTRQGALTIVRGPVDTREDVGYTECRPEYSEEQKKIPPYVGLEDFKMSRGNRDFFIATGTNWKDPIFAKRYPQFYLGLSDNN